MELLVLDTNIFSYLINGKVPKETEIKGKKLLGGSYGLVMPAAVRAELNAMPYLKNWSDRRQKRLDEFFEGSLLVHTSDEIVEAYAEIRAFNNFKLSKKPKTKGAVTMSMNDLWIAATAHVLDLDLLTADKHFDHLDGEYLNVHKITLAL